MGKPTGFMEYDRQLPPDRSEQERIRDWNEFHTHMDTEDLREQGARCMNCGVPFCHTGKIIGGMAMGCPLNNLIPEWKDGAVSVGMEDGNGTTLCIEGNMRRRTGGCRLQTASLNSRAECVPHRARARVRSVCTTLRLRLKILSAI